LELLCTNAWGQKADEADHVTCRACYIYSSNPHPDPVTVQAMHASLEVVAVRATEIFGRQWTKLLYAVGNVTVDPSAGGKDDLAKTARVRLQQMAEDQLKKLGAW
jgi:hypothetical protein